MGFFPHRKYNSWENIGFDFLSKIVGSNVPNSRIKFQKAAF